MDGDVRHRRDWRGAVPVLFAGRDPDHVAGPDFLDGAAPALHATAAGCHNQGLAERMRVPQRPRAGLERDAETIRPRRRWRLEQRVNRAPCR